MVAATDTEGVGEGVGTKTPSTGQNSKQPESPEQAQEVLELARGLAQDEDSPLRRLRVPMSEETDEDVIETDEMPPHRWLGE